MESNNRRKKTLLYIILVQKGQGVTEYMLLLVAIIALVFGVLYKMNDAFRTWGTYFFGDYMVCLIENGYLPSLEGEDVVGSPCSAEFIKYNEASTYLELNPDSGGSGGGNSGGSGGSDGGDSDSGKNSASNKGKDGKGSSGSSTVTEEEDGGGGSGQRKIPISRGLSKRGGRKVVVGTVNKFEPDEDRGANLIDRSKKTKFSKNGQPQVQRARGLGGRFSDGQDDAKRNVVRSISSKKSIGRVSEKVGTITKQLRKIKDAPRSEDKDLTFGSFFRMLVILALIIAVVVVVGGQIMQITKSSD